jgi:hypothetical protein
MAGVSLDDVLPLHLRPLEAALLSHEHRLADVTAIVNSHLHFGWLLPPDSMSRKTRTSHISRKPGWLTRNAWSRAAGR